MRFVIRVRLAISFFRALVKRSIVLELKIVNFIYFYFISLFILFLFIFLFLDLELEVSIILYMTVTNCYTNVTQCHILVTVI